MEIGRVLALASDRYSQQLAACGLVCSQDQTRNGLSSRRSRRDVMRKHERFSDKQAVRIRNFDVEGLAWRCLADMTYYHGVFRGMPGPYTL